MKFPIAAVIRRAGHGVLHPLRVASVGFASGTPTAAMTYALLFMVARGSDEHVDLRDVELPGLGLFKLSERQLLGSLVC